MELPDLHREPIRHLPDPTGQSTGSATESHSPCAAWATSRVRVFSMGEQGMGLSDSQPALIPRSPVPIGESSGDRPTPQPARPCRGFRRLLRQAASFFSSISMRNHPYSFPGKLLKYKFIFQPEQLTPACLLRVLS